MRSFPGYPLIAEWSDNHQVTGVKKLSRAVPARAIELLETRILFDAFQVSVNFQPAKVPTPTGYVADTGAFYGDRGNGYTYGWSGGKLPAITREQFAAKAARNGPDTSYDTFALLYPTGRGSDWQIAVPNGEYTVQVVTGSPIVFPAQYRVQVNGSLVVNGRATEKDQWVSGTEEITVVNGMISLTAIRGTIDRLDSVTITSVSPASLPATPPSPPAPPATLSQPLSWETIPTTIPLPQGEQGGLAEAQSVVADGKLYVFGGYYITNPDYQPTAQAEVFDPTTNVWSLLAPMPAPETHMGVATDGTYIYVAGGYTYNEQTTYQTFATQNVFQYDIATNTWTSYVPLPAARGAGALAYLDGELHFMDGVDINRQGQTDHWVLNPSDANPQWTDATPVPETSNHTVAVILNGDIVICGGQTTSDDSDTIANVFDYDPNTGQWTALASMPYPASHAVAGVIDNQIILMGGTTTDDHPLDTVIVYNPSTNSWSSQTTLPDARLAAVGGIIGNEIIVAAGFGDGQLNAQTWAAFAS